MISIYLNNEFYGKIKNQELASQLQGFRNIGFNILNIQYLADDIFVTIEEKKLDQ